MEKLERLEIENEENGKLEGCIKKGRKNIKKGKKKGRKTKGNRRIKKSNIKKS